MVTIWRSSVHLYEDKEWKRDSKGYLQGIWRYFKLFFHILSNVLHNT